MGIFGFRRHALGIGVAIIMLAGCGGWQAGGPGAMPIGAAASSSQAHPLSGSSGDLIYATTVPAIVVMSYPQGKVVAKIPGITATVRFAPTPTMATYSSLTMMRM